MAILDRLLRGYGRNEARLDLDDVETIDELRRGGLSLRPGATREPSVIRWRLFGEALVMRIAGAAIGIHVPPNSSDVPFYLAYTPTTARSNNLDTHREAVLIGGMRPSRLPWNDGAPTTLVGIGRSPFGAPLTVWRGQSITPVSAQRTVTLLPVMQFADALVMLRQAPSARERARTGDILVQMVTHLALSTWDEHITSAGSYVATAALSYIAQYYTDPSLSPPRVADALGVSLRTLQAALATVGTTPAHKIASHRLGHAAHCLSDPAYDQMSVAHIARLAGFLNADTFRRAFARQFGVSPLGYRRTRSVEHFERHRAEARRACSR